MAQFLTFDACIYLTLLFCVVGLPWLIVTLGLRGSMHALNSFNEAVPPRHAALIARYQDLS
jgi:hypothetical protein